MPGAFRALAFHATLVAMILSQTGCAGAIYNGSHHDTLGDEQPSEISQIVRFGVPEADLSVQVQDGEFHTLLLVLPIPMSGSTPKHRELPIWFELAPLDSEVSFNPSGVRLVNARGDTLRPTAWWGPGVGSLAGGTCRCGEPRDPAKVDFSRSFAEQRVAYSSVYGHRRPETTAREGSASSIRIARPTCFLLQFDARQAGFGFTLLPGTIEAARRQDRFPAIRFRKASIFELWGGGAVWI
jgi:hypothetical protein